MAGARNASRCFLRAKGIVVFAWSFLKVKVAQFKFLFVVKVGTEEQYTWATLTGWEGALVQALSEHVDVIIDNSFGHEYPHVHARGR